MNQQNYTRSVSASATQPSFIDVVL